MIVQAIGSYEFNKNESQTGLHSDIYGIRVTDIDKAGQILAPGTVGIFQGQEFVLGRDGKWRDSKGNVLYRNATGIHAGTPG
jgi:hypothetical protein